MLSPVTFSTYIRQLAAWTLVFFAASLLWVGCDTGGTGTTNQAPDAVDDAYPLVAGDTLRVSTANGVLANDTDPDGDGLTATLDTPPANGSISLNEDGAFTYAPDPDFEGTDSLLYAATDDAGNRSTATVSIPVMARAEARVRFVHASPDAGPVDIFLDDQELVLDVAYSVSPARATAYLDIETRTGAVIDVRDQSGATLATFDVDQANLIEDARYALVLAGAGSATTDAPSAILLRDRFAPIPTDAIGLRIIHGSAQAADAFDSGVDLYLADPGQNDLDGVTPFISSMTFTQDTGDLLLTSAGAFVPQIIDDGSPLSIYVAASGRAQPTVELPLGDGGLEGSPGQYATIVVADVPDGQSGLMIGAQTIVEDAPPEE